MQILRNSAPMLHRWPLAANGGVVFFFCDRSQQSVVRLHIWNEFLLCFCTDTSSVFKMAEADKKDVIQRLLDTRSEILTEVEQFLKETTDRGLTEIILRDFKAVAARHGLKEHLLERFTQEISTVILKVIDTAESPKQGDALKRKIAEICRLETLRPGGRIFVRNFPDHEWRQLEDFWAFASMYFAKPTPFNPPSSWEGESFPRAAVPRYLFRVFDPRSRGSNNHDIVASHTACLPPPSPVTGNDIFSLKPEHAAKILNSHLRWDYDNGWLPDNLTSWTSSLVFALQYAVYRQACYRCRKSEVMLCVIDTTKFPEHQFMQDLDLINYFKGYSPVVAGLTTLSHLREETGYYFGEYLAQGVLKHAGNSRIVSLKQLERNGLYSIYPEFNHNQGRKQWAKRVNSLRRMWHERVARPSTMEIDHTIRLVQACFSGFHVLELTLMFLAMKRRSIITGNPGKWFGDSRRSELTISR
ncbi:hypothetical protein F4780DRAFT_439570 [Xylariomycetidae sp. FL0641]|nr:hypothetical protein F4780DRAFT_439570 [Xylariomycetidae sp. FL0641]